ncbi:MAG: ribbon-helix-helix protein, CopG family [bacterium]|nr:ribbon-helix-helix protein, CopG family [bacterium]
MATDKTYPQIGIRVSEDEKALIEEEARSEHLSVSSFIRSNILKLVHRRRAERQPQAA